MALTTCPACDHQVSEMAATCPQCGHPLKDADAAANAQPPSDNSTATDTPTTQATFEQATREQATHDPPPSSAQAEPFQFNWLFGLGTFVLAVIVAVALIIQSNGPEQTLKAIGTGFGMWLLATLVMYVAARFAYGRKHSHKAKNWTAAVVLLIFCLALPGIIASNQSADGPEALLERLAELREKARSAATASLDGNADRGQILSAQANMMQSVIDEYRAAAEDASGHLKAVLDANVEAFEPIASQFQAYADASEALPEGGFAPARLTSQAAIDEQVQQVRRAAEANRELMTTWMKAPQRYGRLLADTDMPADTRNRMLDMGHQWQLGLVARQMETIVLDNWIDILSLLRSEWGQWEYDQNAGQVVFQSEQALSKFKTIMRSQFAMARHADAMQRRRLAAMEDPSANEPIGRLTDQELRDHLRGTWWTTTHTDVELADDERTGLFPDAASETMTMMGYGIDEVWQDDGVLDTPSRHGKTGIILTANDGRSKRFRADISAKTRYTIEGGSIVLGEQLEHQIALDADRATQQFQSAHPEAAAAWEMLLSQPDNSEIALEVVNVYEDMIQLRYTDAESDEALKNAEMWMYRVD